MNFTILSAPLTYDCRYAYAYAYAYANACSRSRTRLPSPKTRSFLRNLPSTLTRHIYLHTSHPLPLLPVPILPLSDKFPDWLGNFDDGTVLLL